MATCFVSMPPGPSFDAYYKVFARAITQVGFEAVRASEIDHPRVMRDQIFAGVANAAVCLVDLTQRNITPVYVLGLAHGMGKPVIQLVQNQNDLPFDLRFVQHLVYRPGAARWEDMLTLQLQNALRETVAVSPGRGL